MRGRTLLWVWLLPCCATVASEAGDLDAVRPNAGAGPFRLVSDAELGKTSAPYLLRQKVVAHRDPSALSLGAGKPGPTAIYAVAEVGGVHGIYRFVAADGRSFDEPDPPTAVLLPSETWEGAELSGPEVSAVGAEIWLYYAGAEGIGLARSDDGITFVKHGGPVLSAAASGWDAGTAPASPGHLELAPGDHRLFYEAKGAIGEATSPDGVVWQRSAEPVLEPVAAVPEDPPFDAASLADPEPALAESIEGRRITRVYYTGTGADGESAIGLAARFGQSGPLVRALAPALTTPRTPRDPALLALGEVALLYFTQQAGTSTAQDYPALALAVAPATLVLPPPESPNL